MIGRAARIAALVTLATACRPAPEVDASRPEAFAVQTALQPAGGGRLQLVTLPPRLLAAVQRSDLGDIRLFDARGKLVPLALLDGAVGGGARRSVDLRIYPVLGSGDDLRRADLSIRVEGDGATRAVTVDQSMSAQALALPPAAVLLDTRPVRDPVDALVLQADIPAGRPITLTLLASADLKDWEQLAQKVLFKPVGSNELLGGAEVPLDRVDLRDRYVGISWGGVSGVRLTGARALTATAAPAIRTAIATAPLSLTDPHELRFDLPTGARPSAIRLTPSESDGVIPLRLYGRTGREAPWTLVAVATLQADRDARTIELPAPPITSYRLEADRRTAGFSAPPRLELLYDPVELLVAISGTPPYRMAVGQAEAPANYLSLAEIAPQTAAKELAKLPKATLAAGSQPPPPIRLQQSPSDNAVDPRKLALWAALLLGTLALAFAAFRLLRANSANAEGPRAAGD